MLFFGMKVHVHRDCHRLACLEEPLFVTLLLPQLLLFHPWASMTLQRNPRCCALHWKALVKAAVAIDTNIMRDVSPRVHKLTGHT